LAWPEIFGSLNDSGMPKSGEGLSTRDTVRMGGIRADDNPFAGYDSEEEMQDLRAGKRERQHSGDASVLTAEKEGVSKVEIRSKP